jgi:glycerol uptake facilitator protein
VILQGMGFGWIAFGFAFAFYVSLAIWNTVSAYMNPAFLLGLWVMGKLGVGDVFALMAAEFGGAIVGAVLVWLHYLPHFKTMPEPSALTPTDILLRSRDYLPPDNLA